MKSSWGIFILNMVVLNLFLKFILIFLKSKPLVVLEPKKIFILILGLSSVKIEAGISGDIKLGGDVTLKSASLALEFGPTNNKISIKCEFHTTDPPLVITGSNYSKISQCLAVLVIFQQQLLF